MDYGKVVTYTLAYAVEAFCIYFHEVPSDSCVVTLKYFFDP